MVEKNIAELTAELEASQKAEADNLKLAELAQEELEKAKTELAAANEVIADLKNQLAKGVKPSASKETFELNGATYEILGPVNLPGKGKMTALEVATDPEAQALLLQKGSGMIKELK